MPNASMHTNGKDTAYKFRPCRHNGINRCDNFHQCHDGTVAIDNLPPILAVPKESATPVTRLVMDVSAAMGKE